MKLLLLGFSEQNAQALELLVQMDFDQAEVQVIPRQFSDDLKLTLPEKKNSQHCDALIIDLDGVGMLKHDKHNEKLLSDFIKQTPTLLLSRRTLVPWQQSTALNQDGIIYVQKPYNKTVIQESLKELHNIISQPKSLVKQNVTTENVAKPNHEATKPSPSLPTLNDADATTFAKIETKDLAQTWQILKNYFPSVYENKLIEHLLTIINAKNVIQVKVGNYQLLANPKEGCVIIDCDMSRIVDYCSILKTHHQLDDKIQIHTLGYESYTKHLQYLQKLGYQQQSITTLFWQIFDETLDKEMPMRHLLKLKVNFVPNFSAMHFVPTYMHSVISSCLTIPRTVDDIERLFPDLDINQINRVFVLCILSGICDYGILVSTSNHLNNHSEMIKPKIAVTQNKKMGKSGIQKANQTGFFKRLLKKLSF